MFLKVIPFKSSSFIVLLIRSAIVLSLELPHAHENAWPEISEEIRSRFSLDLKR